MRDCLLSDDDREKDAKESRGGRPHRLDHGTLEEFGIGIKRYLCAWSGADVDEIARLCVDLVAAGFIEPPTPALTPEAGTDPFCGSPQRDGKGPCGVSGAGTRATGWMTEEKGYKRA